MHEIVRMNPKINDIKVVEPVVCIKYWGRNLKIYSYYCVDPTLLQYVRLFMTKYAKKVVALLHVLIHEGFPPQFNAITTLWRVLLPYVAMKPITYSADCRRARRGKQACNTNLLVLHTVFPLPAIQLVRWWEIGVIVTYGRGTIHRVVMALNCGGKLS